MVVVLVVFTVAAFILADAYLSTRRQRARQLSLVTEGGPPAATGPPLPAVEQLFLHPAHAWVQLSPGGEVTVGASDLAANFAGDLAAVELPEAGSHLRQGQSAWTLVSSRDRRLDMVMPIEAEVLEVNRELLDDPKRVQHSPYGDGWILRARAKSLGEGLRNLLRGAAARAWREASRASVTAKLRPALGARALDGGEWAVGFGDRLEDADWEALREELFPTEDPPIAAD